MTRKFHNNKSILWLISMGVLIVGFIAFAVLVPSRSPVPGSEGPEVNVPSMQNVPPPSAPNMQLDTQ